MSQSLRGVGPTTRRLLELLAKELDPMLARTVLRHALSRAGTSPRELERRGIDAELIHALIHSVRVHTRDVEARLRCKRRLEQLGRNEAPQLSDSVFTLSEESDIVRARNEGRASAASIGFTTTASVKIATVVSELARNMFRYAGGGTLVIRPLALPKRGLTIIAEDQGPGIPNLDQIMSGGYRSRTGMGLGLLACKRLMDSFEIETGPSGTRVTTTKYLG